jgi:hypothetical protein
MFEETIHLVAERMYIPTLDGEIAREYVPVPVEDAVDRFNTLIRSLPGIPDHLRMELSVRRPWFAPDANARQLGYQINLIWPGAHRYECVRALAERLYGNPEAYTDMHVYATPSLGNQYLITVHDLLYQLSFIGRPFIRDSWDALTMEVNPWTRPVILAEPPPVDEPEDEPGIALPRI